jgi:phage-related protein
VNWRINFVAIIPITAVAWGSPRNFTATPIESNYGKSTITIRSANGLNQVRQQWSIKLVVDEIEKSAIDVFLDNLDGSKPFQFASALNQPGDFTCKDRSWNRLGIDNGFVLWELSMTAIEWFKP